LSLSIFDILVVLTVKFISPNISVGPGCIQDGVSTAIRAVYIIFVANELVILAMTLVHVKKTSRQSSSGLLDKLVRGGLVYSVCTITLSISNLITWCIQWNYPGILNAVAMYFHVIMASRFQLQMFTAYRASHVQCDSEITSLIFEESVHRTPQQEIG